MKLRILLMLGISLASVSSFAQVKIYTGGPQGAYFGQLAPKLQEVLKRKYITTLLVNSAGSIENLTKVLDPQSPQAGRDIGMSQGDAIAVYLRDNPTAEEQIEIIRGDFGYECLFAVVRKDTFDRGITDWLAYAEVSSRIRLVTAERASGAAATLKVIMPLHPRTKNALESGKVVFNQNGAGAAVNEVINNTADMAFFVQLADVGNALFKTINDNNLKIIPVISREIIRQKVGEQSLYIPKENIEVKAGSWAGLGSATTVTTSCTPVTYFTGKADHFRITGADRDDHDDMIKTIKAANASDLVPADGAWSKFLKGAKTMSEAGLEAVLKAGESAANSVVDKMR